MFESHKSVCFKMLVCAHFKQNNISEVAANFTITFLQLTRRTATIENGNMDYKHIFSTTISITFK